MFFPFLEFFSWLAAFSFALNLFDFIDLVLNVFWLFFLVCVSSLRNFLCFLTLTFIGFVSSSKEVFFMLSYFFLTAINSHKTLHLALGLFHMHFAAGSMWAVKKFSYTSFRPCLSDISWRASNLSEPHSNGFLSFLWNFLLILSVFSMC